MRKGKQNWSLITCNVHFQSWIYEYDIKVVYCKSGIVAEFVYIKSKNARYFVLQSYLFPIHNRDLFKRCYIPYNDYNLKNVSMRKKSTSVFKPLNCLCRKEKLMNKSRNKSRLWTNKNIFSPLLSCKSIRLIFIVCSNRQ